MDTKFAIDLPKKIDNLEVLSIDNVCVIQSKNIMDSSVEGWKVFANSEETDNQMKPQIKR